MTIYYHYDRINKETAKGILSKKQYTILIVLLDRLNPDDWNCTLYNNYIHCSNTKRTYNPDNTFIDTTKNIVLHFRKNNELAVMTIDYLKKDDEHETTRTLFFDIAVPSPNKLIKLLNHYRWS
jgi:hypothetical protein